MAAYGPSSLRYQIEGLQNKPVAEKCRVTEDLLKRTSTKELHLVFPALLNSVFGGEGEPGWGLEKLSKSHNHHDFAAARKFLAPDGPLLNAVYSLQADPYASYLFPFRSLPGPSRHTIEEGGVPLFYINKLQTHGFSVPTVVLNPFEMYMFTFAYALVSPAWQQDGTTWSTRLFDWLYPTLVDNYLSHFLPLEGDMPTVPLLPSPLRSPLPQPAVSGRPVHRNVPYSPPRSQRVSLFKPSFMLAQKQHMHATSVLDNTEAETWCSETMLQIFVEFWLNQNSLVAEIPTFSHGAVSSLYYGQKAGGFHYLFEHFMPSLNQVLVVRMMVKYLHYFTNTATTILTSPYQHRVESPLHHFKRTVIPQLVQKKLYWFLRHAFDRWPLDCYFRMVLETWLSYIQPWRYTDIKHYTRGKDSHPHRLDPKDRRVEDKWQGFVEDSLLFYTVLFLELFPRLSRMDFTSPHSAYVLFRLTKVFRTPNLATLLSKAEQGICDVGLSVPMSHAAEPGGIYLAAGRLQPPAPTLPPSLADMEVVGFQYQPLFCDSTRLAVNRLLQKVTEAYVSLMTVQPEKSSGGRFGWLTALFSGEEGGGVDARRTPKYLQQAGTCLADLFDLPRPEWMGEGQQADVLQDSTLMDEDELTPDCIQTPHGPQLTARGRYQIINNQRRFQHWQAGDPDLQPIRSSENATLVRFFYRICSAFNAHFSDDIWQLYQRQDFVGRLAKVFLAPPLAPGQPISSPVSPKMAVRLRTPRVSLRVLASYQTLGLLAVSYVMLHCWLSVGPFSFGFLLLCALMLYGLLRALFIPQSS